MAKQDVCFIILAVLTMVSFVVVQVVSGITMSRCEKHWNFTNRSNDDTDLNPPGWAFSIWFVIYMWQAAWIIYVLTTICRQCCGKPIYQLLNVVTSPFLAIFIVNQLLSLGFFYIYIMQMDETVTPMLSVFSLWVTVLLCLIIYHYQMAAVPPKLACQLRKDVTCLIVLVQNGLAMYLSWLTVADMLVLNSFAVYTVGVPMTMSSCLTLTLLAVIVTVYFFLELTLWRKYVRYTFTTYPTVMWGLMAITVDKWDPQNPTSIYVLVLLLVVSVYFFAKIGVTFGRRSAKGKYAALQQY
ncbi:uncharacterized protein [Apostichopus japonicus]